MFLKLRAVGNSLGVIIPSYVLRSMGRVEGDEISVKIEGYEGVEPEPVLAGSSTVDRALDDMTRSARARREAVGKDHQNEK